MACIVQSGAIFRISSSTRLQSSPFVSIAPKLAFSSKQRSVAICSASASLQSVYDPPALSATQGLMVKEKQPHAYHSQQAAQENSNANNNLLSPEHLIEQTVNDIVSHIHEAPFLHMLFGCDSSTPSVASSCITQRRRLPVNKSLSPEEKWKEVKDCVNSACPSGVILVHRLDEENLKNCCAGDMVEDGDSHCNTNFFGVLVLGKTITRSACYVLKTTTVASPGGKCTAFCLTKAKCFGASWLEQMQSCWLL